MTQHADGSNQASLLPKAARLSFTCNGIRYQCASDWPDDPKGLMPDLGSGAGWPWLQQLQWFEQLKKFQQKNRIQPQSEYLLLRIFQDQQLLIILPLLSPDHQRTLLALSNYYSPEFKPMQPLTGGVCREQLWPILISAMSILWPNWQQLRLHPLSEATARQIQQSCPTRVATLVSDFGHNWRASATSNPDYWQKRQSQLVNTIRRKKKKLLQLGAELQIHRQLTPELMAAYWNIYQRSWKQAEPSTDFIDWLLQFAGEQGQLRLGLLHIDGVAVAFQFWLVQQQQAAIVKLSQDQAFDALSPGTVLMAAMIDDVMMQDGVTEFDFLTGNDDYKAQWMDQCLPLLQLDLFNCQHLSGRLCYLKNHLCLRLRAFLQRWRTRQQTVAPLQLQHFVAPAND